MLERAADFLAADMPLLESFKRFVENVSVVLLLLLLLLNLLLLLVLLLFELAADVFILLFNALFVIDFMPFSSAFSFVKLRVLYIKDIQTKRCYLFSSSLFD